MQENKRRQFIKTMIIGGTAIQIPFIYSCNSGDLNTIKVTIEDHIYNIDIQLFQEIVNILFPKSSIAPSAKELKTDIYYIWLLNDSRLKPKKRHYLAANLSEIDKYCKENYKNKLIDLELNKRKEALKKISLTSWGENYLSSLMTIILESMFANPVYKSNPENIGWKWINFSGGYPQPNKKNKYPDILKLNHISND